MGNPNSWALNMHTSAPIQFASTVGVSVAFICGVLAFKSIFIITLYYFLRYHYGKSLYNIIYTCVCGCTMQPNTNTNTLECVPTNGRNPNWNTNSFISYSRAFCIRFDIYATVTMLQIWMHFILSWLLKFSSIYSPGNIIN